MTDIDIIGKEFLAVDFKPEGILTCNEIYLEFLGKTGVLTHIKKLLNILNIYLKK